MGRNVQHYVIGEAVDAAKAALDTAAEAGKFMSAVWQVRNGMLELVLKTSWEFPDGDCGRAVGQLVGVLLEELFQRGKQQQEQGPPPPLPKANLIHIHKPNGEDEKAEIVDAPAPVEELSLEDVRSRLDSMVDDAVQAAQRREIGKTDPVVQDVTEEQIADVELDAQEPYQGKDDTE